MFWLESVDNTYRGVLIKTIADFRKLKPTLHHVDRRELAYILQDIYLPLEDPNEDVRRIFKHSAEKFALITGTKQMTPGKSNASFRTRWDELKAAVALFARQHAIDPYTGTLK